MAIKVVCDFCEDLWSSILSVVVMFLYRAKQIDTRKLFLHLCKNCAEKLDNIFETRKARKANRREVCARYHELNQEHRDKLGTKG